MRDIRVLTGVQAAARDRAAIIAGTPSSDLMRRAGDRAAQLILDQYSSESRRGVLVFAGSGNNGGDGWVVAAAMQQAGVPVAVMEIQPAATPDAVAARAGFIARDVVDDPGLVIDALLGTGASGAPRPVVAEAMARIAHHRTRGSVVVALDVPSAMDAATGDAELAVRADCTISFGHWKRGPLKRRDLTGALWLVDIGLGDAPEDGSPLAMTGDRANAWTPPIDPLGHKVQRKRLLIAGAAPGFAGASVLTARAALRSGIGMIRFLAHPASIAPLQTSCPEAVALAWPETWTTLDASWPDVLVVGPGFGVDPGARKRLEAVLTWWTGTVVVDADVFTLFAGEASALARRLQGRPAIATPHASEAARMLGTTASSVRSDPELAASTLASVLDCAVLLKGVPTWVCAPGVPPVVVPRGTPALATAGSGDVLAGVVSTLLAQGLDPVRAAATGAYVHGRAAERANTGRGTRGVVLHDVIEQLGHVWGERVSFPEFVIDALPDVNGPRHD